MPATVTTDENADLTAAGVAWDLDPLLGDAGSPERLLDRADAIADEMQVHKGTIGSLSPTELAAVLGRLAEIADLVSRAGHYTSLRFSENTADPARGAAMQAVNERTTAISTRTLFFDLEWARGRRRARVARSSAIR